MSQPVVLFVTHPPKQCGVFEYGKLIFSALAKSTVFDFRHTIVNDRKDLDEEIKKHTPSAIIYNYHPSVMPWLTTKITKGVYRNNIADIQLPQLGIIHEVTQQVADTATNYRNRLIFGRPSKLLNSLFDGYIAPDPTLLLQNPLVYKTGRIIPEIQELASLPSTVTIGSFGFGTPNKGFEKLVSLVQDQFDSAVIRLNIPFADFGDRDGERAKDIARNCRALVKKPGISVEITHDYLSTEEVIGFLAKNSLNAFLYDNQQGRGISSAVDMAIAANRPVAITHSQMFRHLFGLSPSIEIEKRTLPEILETGISSLSEVRKEWTPEVIQWEYENILLQFLKNGARQFRNTGIKKKITGYFRRKLSMPAPAFTWLRNTETASPDVLTPDLSVSYSPVELSANDKLNRILNDEARDLYKPAIDTLFRLCPATMAKKIARANVQQGFVFDTVYRLMQHYDNPRILCVGSYEDTAAMSLIRMGVPVTCIDPMIDYYLQEYYERPTTEKNSFDIIFSTSVIEHDPDDESFVKCIDGLLRPGGYAVVTCDFKEGWKPGDRKPDVDARFYTSDDLRNRLPSFMPSCTLVDEPDWHCPKPDFVFENRYHYSFASFVVRKTMES